MLAPHCQLVRIDAITAAPSAFVCLVHHGRRQHRFKPRGRRPFAALRRIGQRFTAPAFQCRFAHANRQGDILDRRALWRQQTRYRLILKFLSVPCHFTLLLSPPFSQIYRSDNYFDTGGDKQGNALTNVRGITSRNVNISSRAHSSVHRPPNCRFSRYRSRPALNDAFELFVDQVGHRVSSAVLRPPQPDRPLRTPPSQPSYHWCARTISRQSRSSGK